MSATKIIAAAIEAHAAAIEAHAAGLCVVPPTGPNSKGRSPKSPLGSWARFQDEPSSLEQIDEWYARRARTGVGIVTGKVSGNLECLDFDDRDSYERFVKNAKARDLGALVERIESGYCEDTPSGGVHWLYKCERIEGNLKLAFAAEGKVAIETRGEGGYVVVAPTTGLHENGGSYVLRSGGFDRIATITAAEREALHDLARSLDRSPKRAKAEPSANGNGNGQTHHDTFDPSKAPPAERLRRARAYVDKMKEAISGDGGHDQTYHVACELNRFGLGYDDAWTLLNEYNNRCDPEWDEKSLRHKLDDAYRLNGHESGSRLLENRRPQTNGQGHAADNGKADPDRPPPPPVELVHDERAVADQVIEILAREPSVYQRSGELVHVVADDDDHATRGVHRPAGTPRIARMPFARIRELIAASVFLYERRKDRDGNPVEVRVRPPRWLVEAIEARGSWRGVRHLAGVVECPTLRADGTILDAPGYDAKSELLYIPSCEFPKIPSDPTREDAVAAVNRILDIVIDFPFAGDDHRAAWLAALLTIPARPAIAGPTPLFLVSGNAPGAGKGLLADVIGIITSGRTPPKSDYPSTNEELSKTLLAVAVAGDPLIVFDNIAGGGSVGGAALDRCVTSEFVKGRILGETRVVEAPWRAVVIANGNNVSTTADARRRVVLSRLETPDERPEDRTGFRHPRLLDHVREHRPQLVADALTILRAWCVAGKPGVKELKQFGSFEAWSDLVRGAVQWTTRRDPLEPRAELEVVDREATLRRAVVAALAGFLKAQNAASMTTGSILRVLAATPEGPGCGPLAEALAELASGNAALPHPRALGRYLASIAGRPTDGYLVTATIDPHAKQAQWACKPLARGPGTHPAHPAYEARDGR